MERTIQPLHDRLFVRRAPQEDITRGGIYVPDVAKARPQEGEVIAVGNGVLMSNGRRRPIDVKVGDTVLFTKYGGSEIEIDDEDELLVLQESDVLAVISRG